MGVEVQVSLGRLKPASGDVPKSLDHPLVRCVGTEPGNVLFDHIDPPASNPDSVGGELPDRATGRGGIELPPADRPPCSQGSCWRDFRKGIPKGRCITAKSYQAEALFGLD